MAQVNLQSITAGPTYIQTTAPAQAKIGETWMNSSTFQLFIYDGFDWSPFGLRGFQPYAGLYNSGSYIFAQQSYTPLGDSWCNNNGGQIHYTSATVVSASLMGTNYEAIIGDGLVGPDEMWLFVRSTNSYVGATGPGTSPSATFAPTTHAATTPTTFLYIYTTTGPIENSIEYNLLTDAWTVGTTPGTSKWTTDKAGVSWANGRPYWSNVSNDYVYRIEIVARKESDGYAAIWAYDRTLATWLTRSELDLSGGTTNRISAAYIGSSVGNILAFVPYAMGSTYGQAWVPPRVKTYPIRDVYSQPCDIYDVVTPTYRTFGVTQVDYAQMLLPGVQAGSDYNKTFVANIITKTYLQKNDMVLGDASARLAVTLTFDYN